MKKILMIVLLTAALMVAACSQTTTEQPVSASEPVFEPEEQLAGDAGLPNNIPDPNNYWSQICGAVGA